MIAAVTPHAFEVAVELAPAGVEVLRLPEGREQAAFVLPYWSDRETFRALPRLERLRVLQVLSAGTDGIESRVPPWATLCNARGTRDAAVAEWVVAALVGRRAARATGKPRADRRVRLDRRGRAASPGGLRRHRGGRRAACS